MTGMETLIAAGGAILLYSLLSSRFSKAVQPLRLKVIDDVGALCADDGVPEEIKSELRSLSNQLFSRANGWLIVLVFPFVLASSTFGRKQRKSTVELSPAKRAKVSHAIGMGLFCMIANSPLCTLIFAGQFIISLAVAGPWGWTRSLLRAVTKVDLRLPDSFKLAG